MKLCIPVRALTVCAVLAGFLSAQSPVESPDRARISSALPAIAPVIERDHVFYDAPGDGSLWASGRNYKIGFEPGIVTYLPFLGSRAPRNFPLTLRLESVSAGGEALSLLPAPAPSRQADRVSYDRGQVVECYDLTPLTVEQLFRFDRIALSGDLVVRLAVVTDLACSEDAAGLRFGNDLGHVHYRRAVAIDAGGARCPAETRPVAGGIEIRVPDSFLAQAQFPLVIDPVIAVVTLATTLEETFAPDVAFEGGTGNFMVVWESVFSAADHDVFSQIINFNGTPVAGGGAAIDLTATYWSVPRVAGLRTALQFLTVAQVGLPGTPRIILGRTRSATGSVLGPQFVISGPETGDKMNPDVGGDPLASAPSYYSVVWERVFSPGDHDVHGRLVTPGSNLLGTGTLLLSDTGDDDRFPAISNSDGGATGSAQAWTVVWQRDAGGEHDIYGARLAWNGAVLAPPFPLETSLVDTTFPSVSTMTGAQTYLVAFEAAAGPSLHDIGFLIMQGTGVITGSFALSFYENVSLDDRSLPIADSDGCTFTIAYAERYFGNPADYDIYATTLHLAGGTTAGVSESRALLAGTGNLEDHAAIASSFGGGGPGLRHLIVWDELASSFDVRGVLYDARAPSGGFQVVPTGCQGLNLAIGGIPAIGQSVSFTLTNAFGNSLLAFGLPVPPVTYCGACRLGVDVFQSFLVPGPAVSALITCDGSLVGLQIEVQGADLGGFGCNGLRLSDTVIVTIQ